MSCGWKPERREEGQSPRSCGWKPERREEGRSPGSCGWKPERREDGQSPEELRVEARAEEEARAEKMRIGRCGGGERRRTGGAREVVGHANEANRAPKKCPRAKEGQSTNSGRIRGEGEDHRGREETRRREREGTSSRWSGTKSWGARDPRGGCHDGAVTTSRGAGRAVGTTSWNRAALEGCAR